MNAPRCAPPFHNRRVGGKSALWGVPAFGTGVLPFAASVRLAGRTCVYTGHAGQPIARPRLFRQVNANFFALKESVVCAPTPSRGNAFRIV